MTTDQLINECHLSRWMHLHAFSAWFTADDFATRWDTAQGLASPLGRCGTSFSSDRCQLRRVLLLAALVLQDLSHGGGAAGFQTRQVLKLHALFGMLKGRVLWNERLRLFDLGTATAGGTFECLREPLRDVILFGTNLVRHGWTAHHVAPALYVFVGLIPLSQPPGDPLPRRIVVDFSVQPLVLL